jgi:ABC-2 type transport system ATP-binding protein
MSQSAVSIEHVSKKFRLYHEKNQYLKTALLRGGRAKYEDFWALKDISFEVPAGSTFGIIGSNGSGKSTLLKCLAGILTPDQGSITHRGKVVALLELGAGFHPDLSGRENIFLNGVILGMTQKEIEKKFDEIVAFSGLEEFIDTPVKNYSSGMTVRLGFAIAINVDPDILVIDEVLAVGDAQFQLKCLEKIENFRQDGRTIIIVSHGLADISNICDTVAWIEKGVLKELGPASYVINKYSGDTHHPKSHTDSQRWGSGEIQFNEVLLLDHQDRTPNSFQTGETLTVLASYTSRISLSNSCISLQIMHLDGREIWATNSGKRSIEIPIKEGDNKISVDLLGLPLLDGVYEISLTIFDSSGLHVYDHWEKALSFDVHQDPVFSTGLINIKTNWNI